MVSTIGVCGGGLEPAAGSRAWPLTGTAASGEARLRPPSALCRFVGRAESEPDRQDTCGEYAIPYARDMQYETCGVTTRSHDSDSRENQQKAVSAFGMHTILAGNMQYRMQAICYTKLAVTTRGHHSDDRESRKQQQLTIVHTFRSVFCVLHALELYTVCTRYAIHT